MVMATNICYRRSFFLAKGKEKWAQKIQNHSLTKISSKISSPLGFNFQKSIEHLPLLWLHGLYWAQTETRQHGTRGHVLSVFCAPSVTSSLRGLSWFDSRVGIPGHTEAALCPRELFCQQKKNRSLETYRVYQECTFTLSSLPALILSFFWLTSTSLSFINFRRVVLGVHLTASAGARRTLPERAVRNFCCWDAAWVWNFSTFAWYSGCLHMELREVFMFLYTLNFRVNEIVCLSCKS